MNRASATSISYSETDGPNTYHHIPKPHQPPLTPHAASKPNTALPRTIRTALTLPTQPTFATHTRPQRPPLPLHAHHRFNTHPNSPPRHSTTHHPISRHPLNQLSLTFANLGPRGFDLLGLYTSHHHPRINSSLPTIRPTPNPITPSTLHHCTHS